MRLVVDASMTLAWIFSDERAHSSRTVLQRVVAGGALVPSLWRLEVANALRSAIRRRRCDEHYAIRSLERLSRLRITVDPETDAHAWGATRELSTEHDLTLYDAAYLELALRRTVPLASCDGALTMAAKNAGVETIG